MHNTPTTNKMGRCMESAFGAADGLQILSRYPPLPAFSPRAYRYLTSVQQQQQQQQFISSDQPNRGPSAFSIPSQRHYATLPTAAPPVASNFIFQTLNSPLRLSPTNATRADDSSSPAPAGFVSSPPIHQTSLVRCVNRCLVDDDGGGKERKRNAKTVQLTALQVTGERDAALSNHNVVFDRNVFCFWRRCKQNEKVYCFFLSSGKIRIRK